MFIGIGTIVLIVIIVLVIMMLRRRWTRLPLPPEASVGIPSWASQATAAAAPPSAIGPAPAGNRPGTTQPTAGIPHPGPGLTNYRPRPGDPGAGPL